MTWLGLTGKFVQGNISTLLTPTIPTIFWPTMSPTLRLTLRPSLRPSKCHTPMPLLQLADDNVRDGDQFGISVSVFGGWVIVVSPSDNNLKGRSYLYKRVRGPGTMVK